MSGRVSTEGAVLNGRLVGHTAPCRHLAANLLERGGIECVCGRGKQLVVLDGNVCLVECLKRHEVFAQRRGVSRLELAVFEPAAAEAIHCSVMRVGGLVILFEPLHDGQRPLCVGIAARAETREQAVLLVRRVLRGGCFEIRQGALERGAVFNAKRTTGRVQVNRDQHAQEVLDPAMTVAQEIKRLVKPVT